MKMKFVKLCSLSTFLIVFELLCFITNASGEYNILGSENVFGNHGKLYSVEFYIVVCFIFSFVIKVYIGSSQPLPIILLNCLVLMHGNLYPTTIYN